MGGGGALARDRAMAQRGKVDDNARRWDPQVSKTKEGRSSLSISTVRFEMDGLDRLYRSDGPNGPIDLVRPIGIEWFRSRVSFGRSEWPNKSGRLISNATAQKHFSWSAREDGRVQSGGLGSGLRNSVGFLFLNYLLISLLI